MKIIFIVDPSDDLDDAKLFYDAVADEASKSSFKFLHLEICTAGFLEELDS